MAMEPEVRMARFLEAYWGYHRNELTCEQAGELLGMSERQFRRLRDRYEAEGAEGIADRRLGRKAHNQAPVDDVEWMVEQFVTRYRDFSVQHFHEVLQRDHDYRYGYTFTKTVLQSRGLAPRAKSRGKHRRRRPRRPMRGMMLFQDASTYLWLPSMGRRIDLVVTMDDATSEIYSAFLVEEEGTASSFRGLRETILARGLFGSFYTDRGGHYFVNRDGKADPDRLTQVGRALMQLGIEHIASYAPQGRGRVERVFGTLQGRLPQELRLAGIGDMEGANRFLRNSYIAAHNARFAVTPDDPQDQFVPFASARHLDDILCIQESRVVGNDNCVRYNTHSLQIPPQSHRHHYAKARVKVHEYADGSMAIFHGPQRIASYAPDGAPLRMPAEDRNQRAA